MTKDVDDSLLAGLLQALMDLGQEIFSTRMLQEIRNRRGNPDFRTYSQRLL